MTTEELVKALKLYIAAAAVVVPAWRPPNSRGYAVSGLTFANGSSIKFKVLKSRTSIHMARGFSGGGSWLDDTLSWDAEMLSQVCAQGLEYLEHLDQTNRELKRIVGHV